MMVVAGTVTVSLEVGADANKIKKTVTLTLVCNTRFCSWNAVIGLTPV